MMNLPYVLPHHSLLNIYHHLSPHHSPYYFFVHRFATWFTTPLIRLPFCHISINDHSSDCFFIHSFAILLTILFIQLPPRHIIQQITSLFIYQYHSIESIAVSQHSSCFVNSSSGHLIYHSVDSFATSAHHSSYCFVIHCFADLSLTVLFNDSLTITSNLSIPASSMEWRIRPLDSFSRNRALPRCSA